MEQRLNYPRLAPEANRAMTALGSYLAACGLEHPLLELVKIRASQMNGCSFCIDMHTKDARAGGETEQRIYALSAWRETRAGCPRLGGGPHPYRRRGARRPLRGGEEGVLREGAGRSDLGGRRHQRLEPCSHQHARRARGVPAEGATCPNHGGMSQCMTSIE